MHLCTFAEVGAKAPGAAKACQLAGARPGDYEPRTDTRARRG
jgi:hypothetical protein